MGTGRYLLRESVRLRQDTAVTEQCSRDKTLLARHLDPMPSTGLSPPAVRLSKIYATGEL